MSGDLNKNKFIKHAHYEQKTSLRNDVHDDPPHAPSAEEHAPRKLAPNTAIENEGFVDSELRAENITGGQRMYLL